MHAAMHPMTDYYYEVCPWHNQRNYDERTHKQSSYPGYIVRDVVRGY